MKTQEYFNYEQIAWTINYIKSNFQNIFLYSTRFQF